MGVTGFAFDVNGLVRGLQISGDGREFGGDLRNDGPGVLENTLIAVS